MFKYIPIIAIAGLLAACGNTNPFDTDATSTDGNSGETGGTGTDGSSGNGDTGDVGGDTGGIDGGSERPPGTANPTVDESITRREIKADSGGLVQDVRYNASTDTLTIDNLGFDGSNAYSRDNQVSSLGSYAVYEAEAVYYDDLTGNPIPQVGPYRAIYGVSQNDEGDEARTSFAIARTGGYVNYGFGGFLYERNGGVVIPSSGQAVFRGDYAGIRTFDNRGGLEYTQGDVQIAVDFEDFNDNSAVQGSITNRTAFTASGEQIQTGGAGELALPNIYFAVSEGTDSLFDSGELQGTLSSHILNEEGALETYESGTYYGIMAGDATDPDDGGEIVGIFVVTSEDTRYEGVNAQETGGFIVYR